MALSLLQQGTASMWGSGDLGKARAFYEEALAVSRELGSASIFRVCLNSLALPYLLQGDLERAAELAEEAAALSREAGDRILLPLPLHILGWVALLRGDLGQAEALHKESLALSGELGDSWGTLELLEGLACIAGAKGEAEKAARLFGSAEALREAMGVGPWAALRTLEERYLVGARSRLKEGAWRRAWGEGYAMSMESGNRVRPLGRGALHDCPLLRCHPPRASIGRAHTSGDGGTGASSRRANQPAGSPKTLPEPPNGPEAPQLRLPQAGGELSGRGHASRPGARSPLKLAFRASGLFSLLLMGICPLPHIGNMGMPFGPFGRSPSDSAAP